MKKRILATLLTVVMVVGLAAGCGSKSVDNKTESDDTSAAKESKPVTLMVSHSNKETGGTAIASEEFKKLVEDAGKDITVDIYGNNALGDEATVFESVMAGTVAIQMVSTSTLSKSVSEAAVMDVPFLFDDMEQFWKVVKTDEFTEAFEKYFEGSGLHFLGFINCNNRAVSNTKKAIHSPEDMKGLNIRILEGQVYQDLFAALGSGTTTLAISEVFTSLQNGLIDGEDMGISYIVPSGFAEAENYFTDTNHTVQPVVAIINQEIWDGMSDEQQKVVSDAIDEAGTNAGSRFEDDYKEYLQTAKDQYGMEVTLLTDDEREVFKEAAADVIDKYANATPECKKLYDLINSLK